MRSSILIILLLYIATPAFSQGSSLVRVVDGDTVVVIDKGHELEVDLRDIDAPELGQYYGSESRKALIQVLKNRECVFIRNKIKKQNGRTAGDVLAGSRNVSWWLVQNGSAWSKSRSFNNSMLKLEEKARKGKLGLWENNPEPPWLWRKRNNIDERRITSVFSELSGQSYNSNTSEPSSSNLVAMEIRRIEEKIANLKRRCQAGDPASPGEDWCSRGPKQFQARIKQLQTDPEYYFYKKDQSIQRKKPVVVIDSNGNAVFGVPVN